METAQTILPIILSAVAIAFSVAQWVGGKGQRDATEASTLTDSAMGLVTQMRAEIKELRQEIAEYERRIDEMEAAMLASQEKKDIIINTLTARVDELEKQVKALEVEKDHWKQRAEVAEKVNKGKMNL
jgi:cell division protein FtsB